MVWPTNCVSVIQVWRGPYSRSSRLSGSGALHCRAAGSQFGHYGSLFGQYDQANFRDVMDKIPLHYCVQISAIGVFIFVLGVQSRLMFVKCSINS